MQIHNKSKRIWFYKYSVHIGSPLVCDVIWFTCNELCVFVPQAFTRGCLFVIFFATFNNYSVMWWRSVFIGGRKSPDTLYNVNGGDHWPSASTLTNFLIQSHSYEQDSNRHGLEVRGHVVWDRCLIHSAMEVHEEGIENTQRVGYNSYQTSNHVRFFYHMFTTL
jgi:hypothetical protein